MHQPDVFPACAGMFRFKPNSPLVSTGFPRVRGDVPPWAASLMPSTPFSPRARGCSAFGRMWDHIKEVFPACAGMFLKLSKLRLLALSFPRVRGDVPLR